MITDWGGDEKNKETRQFARGTFQWNDQRKVFETREKGKQKLWNTKIERVGEEEKVLRNELRDKFEQWLSCFRIPSGKWTR